jgi:hypothetical protein
MMFVKWISNTKGNNANLAAFIHIFTEDNQCLRITSPHRLAYRDPAVSGRSASAFARRRTIVVESGGISSSHQVFW